MMQRRRVKQVRSIDHKQTLLTDEEILQHRMRWVLYAVRRLCRGRYPRHIPRWLRDPVERMRVFSA